MRACVFGGEVGHLSGAQPAQLHLLEYPMHALPALISGSARGQTQFGGVAQRLFDGERGMQQVVSRYDPDVRPQVISRHLVAVEMDCADTRLHRSAQQVDQRRGARLRRADDRGERAGLGGERQIRQHLLAIDNEPHLTRLQRNGVVVTAGRGTPSSPRCGWRTAAGMASSEPYFGCLGCAICGLGNAVVGAASCGRGSGDCGRSFCIAPVSASTSAVGLRGAGGRGAGGGGWVDQGARSGAGR